MIQSVSAELIQEIDSSGNGAVEWLEYKKSAVRVRNETAPLLSSV